MATFADQTGRTLNLPNKPLRIVSTVPSQTELLYYLGLANQTVGITAYCVHPNGWLKSKTVIGGTKDLQLAKIRDLKPDLIIGNKEENIKEQIEALAEDIPVYLSDIKDVESALGMISDIGQITQSVANANALVQQIQEAQTSLKASLAIPSLYFIWKEPYMVASPSTFISSMMAYCGYQNVATSAKGRYPEITLEEIRQSPTQLILLSSEPYAFTTADAHIIAQETGKKVKIIDGEIFSWYGSRMLKAFTDFKPLQKELSLWLGPKPI